MVFETPKKNVILSISRPHFPFRFIYTSIVLALCPETFGKPFTAGVYVAANEGESVLFIKRVHCFESISDSVKIVDFFFKSIINTRLFSLIFLSIITRQISFNYRKVWVTKNRYIAMKNTDLDRPSVKY